jgi:molybdate transport system ATP-binding protein
VTRFELSLELPLADFELRLDVRSDARCLGVFGPSGAGKTSLLESLAGWRRPRRARLVVDGRTLVEDGRRLDLSQRRCGYVPQDALLFPHKTVLEQLRMAPRANDRAFERKVLEVLELEELVDRYPNQISGGQARRVALARALCSRPEVLLLDEPLGALDVPLRRRILPYLMRASESFELPLLFVSHDPTEIQALCQETLILERGRVVAQGPPERVLAESPLTDSFENLLPGTVREVRGGTAFLDVGGQAPLRVPAEGLGAGQAAVAILRSEDILVARAPVDGLSARNVLPARVVDVRRTEQQVVLFASLGTGDRPLVSVALTAESTEELELAPGREVWLLAKTQAVKVLGNASSVAAGTEC